MSGRTQDHSQGSASPLPSNSDWAHKKQIKQLQEVSQQLALNYTRMQDHAGAMRQVTGQLFGKLASVDSVVDPDVRLALLQNLTILWVGLFPFRAE